jgi:hypothetical protein
MSEVRVNKISPRSGTTVTLGDNGDTITIPSGVTLSTTSFSSTGIDDNATSTAITIDSSERVGIGTASPDQLLHVKSAGNTKAKIEAGTASTFGQLYLGTENQFIIGYGSTHSVADALSLKNLNASGTIRFFNNGDNERMRIDSSGNLGIGTSSPSSALDVSGGLTIDGNDNSIVHSITRQTATTNTSRPVIKLTAKNTASDVLDNFGSAIQFNMKDNTADTELGAIGFLRDGADGSGKFVVGQDSQLLSSSPQFIVNSSGNVGIGESNPGNNLVVDGGANTTIRVQNDTPYYGDFQATTTGIQIRTVGSYPLILNTNQTERMRILHTGNVGIGTTSPESTLHVVGTNQLFSPLRIQPQSTNGTSAFSIRQDATQDRLTLGLAYSSASVIIGNRVKPSNVSESDATGFLSSSTSNTARTAMRFDIGGHIQFYNAPQQATAVNSVVAMTERMRINSSGQTLIGTTVAPDNANTKLMVHTPISSSSLNVIEMSHNTNGANKAGAALGLSIGNGGEATNAASLLFKTASGGSLGERMRIDSFGNVLVGKTVTTGTVTGCIISPEGYGLFTRPASTVLVANRQSDDGTVIGIFQAGTEEGTISVSGTTVSYNGFTGTHWSRFQDNSTPTILRGTVLETLDEMCDWYNLEFDVITQDENGNDVTTPEKIPHVLTDTESNGDVITYNHEGTDVQATIVKEGDVKHMMSKVSDNSDAKNVYGVFVAYDLDGEGYNDFYVASVGSFVVRIKANETIAKGDLLQSNGDGTAKVQSDDNIKSSSFAKVLSTTIIETYEDGSYLVPCSLMC